MRVGSCAAVVAVGLLVGCGGEEDPSLSDRLSDMPRSSVEIDTASQTDSTARPPAIQNPSPALSFEEARIDPPEDPSDEWTTGIVDVERSDLEMTTLQQVRVARNEGFDRVVIEFAEGRVPDYHLEYIDKPVRQCGSGNPVPIAGDGWLEIRLFPARAHTDAGSPTIADRERILELPIIRELQMICDFEGYVEWVVGTSSPNEYRAFELSGPSRLVIDIQH